MRKAKIERKTRETDIKLELNIDGSGEYGIDTGIGFFNHMLDLFSHHSKIDLTLACKGDLDVDFHHTVEDVGILLGQAIEQALGDKRSIKRYGYMVLPMDEALALVSVDISGRPFVVFDVPEGNTGGMELQIFEEFFRALAFNAGITLHIKVFYGANPHHIIEAVFKAFARAMREAVLHDSREAGIPSSKGVL
ncbi:MAG TPA: imidazoleglycerol-phosphate dehydratase HisB [Clostridia bacterium]|nr:imidazoleglycerol-phosphate dehydratase HisB [Clostridia bacterium]